MMGDHILIASESLKRTGESMDLHCQFCNRKTAHKVGYMGSLCLDCGLQMFDFDAWPELYSHIKKKYGLQRKDVARILNLSPGTVSNYQSTWCGRLVEGLLKWHYKQMEQAT